MRRTWRALVAIAAVARSEEQLRVTIVPVEPTPAVEPARAEYRVNYFLVEPAIGRLTFIATAKHTPPYEPEDDGADHFVWTEDACALDAQGDVWKSGRTFLFD